MRIWDLPPSKLCRIHLLGEHRELHAIWTVLSEDRKGYRNHPETKRWEGKLKALYARHALLVTEMKARGYNHQSPLDKKHAKGKAVQDEFVDTIAAQKRNLQGKGCACSLS